MLILLVYFMYLTSDLSVGFNLNAKVNFPK